MTSMNKDASDKGKTDRKYYSDYVQGALRKVMLDMFDDVADSKMPRDTSSAIKILIQFILYCVVGDTDMVIKLSLVVKHLHINLIGIMKTIKQLRLLVEKMQKA